MKINTSYSTKNGDSFDIIIEPEAGASLTIDAGNGETMSLLFEDKEEFLEFIACLKKEAEDFSQD
jgi:hypothetical protein